MDAIKIVPISTAPTCMDCGRTVLLAKHPCYLVYFPDRVQLLWLHSPI